MFYATLKTIHLLSVIVWIGGMVFAHFFLRPALTPLAAPDRVRLMHDVLGRFFGAVLVLVGFFFVFCFFCFFFVFFFFFFLFFFFLFFFFFLIKFLIFLRDPTFLVAHHTNDK